MKTLILLTLAMSIVLQLQAQTLRFDKKEYTTNWGDTLRYRMLYPDADTVSKYPLVLFLHGRGERGNDNESQLKWGVQQFASDEMMVEHPAIVIAPQCPVTDWWSNGNFDRNRGLVTMNPEPSKTMDLVIGLVSELIENLPIDTNRIYITGISMGGMGTYDAIMRNPDLFTAAVPVCGAGDTSYAKKIAHIPMWIYHGGNDVTVKASASNDMQEALIRAGAMPGLTIYPSVGHFSWLGAYSDMKMYDWLFKQRKY